MSEDLEYKLLLSEIIALEDTKMNIDVNTIIEHIKHLRSVSTKSGRLTTTELRTLRDTLLESSPPRSDVTQEPNKDMPKLDDMLKGLMKFETKLFGEEDEAKLRAFISQLKADEAGHVEEVKDSIQHLEAYRSTLTDATLPIPKAAADRMILLAEVFTSMIASAPVVVVVESIQAMKASGEKPSIEELEEASRRMLDMLDGSKSDTQGVSDDMPADDQADVSTKPDMPGEVDMPSGIDTRTHDQAMASAEIDRSVDEQADVSLDQVVFDTEPTELSSTASSTTSASSSSSSSSTTTVSSSKSSSPSSTSATTTTTPEPSDPGFAPSTDGQILESTDGRTKDANDANDSSFEKYKLPLIVVGSVLSGVVITLGAVAGIRFSRRNVASTSSYADMQNADSIV